MGSSAARIFSMIMVVVLTLLGAILSVGGVWLIAVGGSWYYLICGLAFLATAALVFKRRPEALSVFAALIVATLLWALYEVGFDWWPLAARGDVVFVIGALLLLPWVTGCLGTQNVAEALDGIAVTPSVRRGSGLALSGSLVLAVIVAAISWFSEPYGHAGKLPQKTAAIDSTKPEIAAGDWDAYGRTQFGQRYSPLDQITPQNVAGLKVAWQFHTGDTKQPGDPVETTFEVTPLKIGERLYLCTPHQNVIALDATTGKEIWRYDPIIQGKLALQHLTCRGLSYQATRLASAQAPGQASTGTTAAATPAVNGTAPARPAASGATGGPADPRDPNQPVAARTAANITDDCDGKLFMPTADGRLIALDLETGAVCTSFGGGDGQIDLWHDMPNVDPGSYYSTSPAIVTENLVIVGGTVLDNVSTSEASGVIRAFDVDTGALVWNWDSGNPDQTAPLPAGQSYTANSPNSWSIMSADQSLGMVYVPLGNQPPDQWGADRSASVEKYSSSVVALDIATGKVRWVFQTVHHDLWDYDVPAQPSLIDLSINGRQVPALVQPTKQGEVFVLNRETGEPIVPVRETRAPDGAVAPDRSAPTQPVSALSFDPDPLTESDMWGGTLFDQMACRIAFHGYRYDGRFTPPSLGGSLIYPGNFGVFNWGSVAVDPERGVMFGTPTYLAFVSKLVPRDDDTQLVVNASQPKGALPALNENFGAPYGVSLKPFTSILGLPCQAPPWGTIAGADLSSGEIVWQHRNGTVRDASPIPLPFKMGVPNLGGPIMTKGGVAFLSGTLDYYVRGYDVTTGAQLWEARLPAGGQATPMTYEGADGRQFLVVVAGGHGSLGTKAGDSIIAYALPKGGKGAVN